MSKNKNNSDPFHIYGTEFALFLEDVSFPHVLNYRDAFTVSGDNSEEFIELFENKWNYSSDIFDIVQNAIKELILYGNTYIEIDIIEDAPQIKQISIKNIEKKKNIKEKEKILKIKFPKLLQNKKSRSKMLSEFKKTPNLVEISKLNQEKIPYDFGEFIEIRNKCLATLTGDFYWDARDLFRGKMTFGYYLFYQINNRIAQIILIDTILAAINEELVKVGASYGINNYLVPKYILTKQELHQLLIDLQEGTIQLKDIYKKLFSDLY